MDRRWRKNRVGSDTTSAVSSSSQTRSDGYSGNSSIEEEKNNPGKEKKRKDKRKEKGKRKAKNRVMKIGPATSKVC